MKRNGYGIWFLGMMMVILVLPTLALAQQHLELMDPTRDPIPPDGAAWHELWPAFCTNHTQQGYNDNGDGIISACDGLRVVDDAGNVQDWHITWVGPTYYLVNPNFPDDFGYLEPTEPQSGDDPTCEMWLEVFPNYGNQWHIDGWTDDNADGVLSVCDMVMLGGEWYHVENIGLNVVVEPGPPVANDQKTWGQLKNEY